MATHVSHRGKGKEPLEVPITEHVDAAAAMAKGSTKEISPDPDAGPDRSRSDDREQEQRKSEPRKSEILEASAEFESEDEGWADVVVSRVFKAGVGGAAAYYAYQILGLETSPAIPALEGYSIAGLVGLCALGLLIPRAEPLRLPLEVRQTFLQVCRRSHDTQHQFIIKCNASMRAQLQRAAFHLCPSLPLAAFDP